MTVVGIIGATIFGILIGMLGVVPNKFAQGISTTIIYIFRGLPLLVLALFIYNGIPSLTGSKIPAFIAGIITLTLNEGAYTAAFVKGGIEAVDKGQMEAARSLGLSFGKSMRKVILPQGVKIMIPSFINQFIITLKDSSILSIIGGVGFVVLWFIGFFSDHRTFTHSLTALSLFSLAVWLIYPPLLFGFVTAYLSHLLLDILNKKKMKFLQK